MESEKLMTSDDVAEYLRTTRKYVYRLIHSGQLEFYRIGIRDIRFSKDQVKAFLARDKGNGQK